MVKFTVIGGGASKDLAKRLARKLKAVYIKTETKIFPDGESKVTLQKIPKKSVILVVQSTYPPVDTNLLQTLSIISQVRKVSSRTFAIMPYMGYARQDKQFLNGEVITMSAVAKMLQSVGAKKVIVVDIHSNIALNHFKIPTENVSAIPELAKYFKKLNLKNPLVVSPDMGGYSRSKKFASLLKTDFIVLKKHRDRKTGRVSIQTAKVDVQGKDLILVDDIISTGGSIIKAAQFLKKQKCKRVFVACTHGLLVEGAEKKIRKAGVSRIISTNTIPGNTSKVDISGILAKSVQ
ncbi:MAG TPA: ribose-phosphate pyrophosphokinase [Candidatus Nitrosopelagicus sp.]|uniref:Ribose-phosphate pyrophosphokinase n=1 Tax=uncultured marine crenarchaeote HF4000_APKG8I13 TaxID=455606 RepID=B3TAY7_9ARCH|nr:putative phosphoribosyl transferase domain protein [uncultured marine crenarchaeote HF4000_APKG8I13]HIO32826.1 ribose-phosphate pyrophosphokinase [Candidatus Nitrosopelagicus sp.]